MTSSVDVSPAQLSSSHHRIASRVDNLLYEVTLRGPLNRQWMQQALAAVRTVVELDLSQSSDSNQEFSQLRQRVAGHRFEPTGVSYQSYLVCMGKEQHSWLFVVDACRWDTESCRLVWERVSTHYQALERDGTLGAPASDPDYQAALTTYRQSEQSQIDKAYFAAREQRALEKHRFLHKPPATPGAPALLRHDCELDKTLVKSIIAGLSAPSVAVAAEPRALGPTVNPALSSFFQSVLLGTLWRLGGSREQALGVALRPALPPRAHQLGQLTHWLPLGVELQDSDSFASLQAQLHTSYCQLLEHSEAPGNCIADQQSLVFEATLDVRSEVQAPANSLSASEQLTCSAHYLPRTSEPASQAGASAVSCAVAWTVNWPAAGGKARLSFDFDSRRFGEKDALRFVNYTLRLLKASAKAPQQCIAKVPLLEQTEIAQLLELNPAPVPVGPDVFAAFTQHVFDSPDNPALRHRATNLSYAQLSERANLLASGLAAQGVEAGDRVAIALERGVDLVASLLACLQLNAAYVPLDPSHPASRNAIVLEVANPKAMLTGPVEAADLQELAHCPVLFVKDLLRGSCDGDAIARAANCAPITLDPIAYILFTSGSTGKPKGVQVQRSALTNFLCSMQKEPGFGAKDALLSVTTISFDIAALEVFLPLVSGGWLEMMDRLEALDPRILMAKLNSGEFSVLQATPATWRMLLEANWPGTPALKALCGGEALPPALAQKLCPRTSQLWNLYGPTETTIWSTAELVSPSKQGISIGRPIDNTQIYVLDDQQALVPQGVVGELVIGGLGVSLGYAQQPSLTAEKFLKDPYASSPETSSSQARMYRTGDLGRWLADGSLECLGRIDFQVKIRGFRIELGEIETAIAQQGGLSEGLVVARELQPGDPSLVAYGKTEADFDAGQLRKYLQEHLPSYMVPAYFVPIETWPLTQNGKIDRKALPAPDDSHRAADQVNYEPPQTELERRIAEVWCTTLNTQKVGRHENLFDNGKSSLDAIRLLSALAQMPEGEVPLGAFLKTPTVSGIAELLQSNGPEDAAVVIPLNHAVPCPGKPPLFCVCGLHLYSEMAHAMPDHPVLGVYLPLERLLLGIDAAADKDALPTLEQVATAYVQSVVEHQPEGPYLLAGLSFGGVVAFEMARQLKAKNQEVQLLALFDSVLPQAQRFNFRDWLAFHARATRKQGLGYLWNHPGVQRRLATVAQLAQLARLPRNASPMSTDNATPAQASQSVAPVSERALEEQQWAERREEQVRTFDIITDGYVPRMSPQAGDALFFRAMNEELGPGHSTEQDGGWQHWMSGNVPVYPVAGDHLTILQGDSATYIASTVLKAISKVSLPKP